MDNNTIYDQLSRINYKLNYIIGEINYMSKEFDDLTAQVKANTAVLDSAVVLINGIADRISSAGVDPVKLKELTDELHAKDEELSAAVVANT